MTESGLTFEISPRVHSVDLVPVLTRSNNAPIIEFLEFLFREPIDTALLQLPATTHPVKFFTFFQSQALLVRGC
jgi:hypothetical protein